MSTILYPQVEIDRDPYSLVILCIRYKRNILEREITVLNAKPILFYLVFIFSFSLAGDREKL